MTFKTEPRVRETSVTAGVGTYTLDGAPVGYQAFASLGANNHCPYFATDGTNWEEGIGRVLTGPARIERTHVLDSSNAGAAVDWPAAGTRTLRCGWISQLAVPRFLSKDVAGGVGTTLLTQDEQRRTVIELTGVLTGNRTIEVDATPWNWIIRNSTTGAFTLTFKVTGQAGILVPQSKRAFCYCDGVDVRAAAAMADAVASEFAAGTRLLFQQTTAPVGWTKETAAAYNDAAIRFTTGTVGTGGADAFSTHFGTGKSTAGFTLTVSEMPAHKHALHGHLNLDNNSRLTMLAQTLDTTAVDGSMDNTGGGGSHAHVLNSFDIKFADTIIAAKD